MPSHLEVQFAQYWVHLYPGIDLHSEYRFAPPRRFRFDFAHPSAKVGIEIQGAIWSRKSGHSGGSGNLKDYEKQCIASASGWLVFPLAEAMITDEYLRLIADTIQRRQHGTTIAI